MAGYSGTPLPKKLGLKPGMRAASVGAPGHYRALVGTLSDIRFLNRPGKEMDFMHLFCTTAAELQRRLPGARDALARDGTLWVSWPKKSSGLQRDLDESGVRHAGLAAGLVDVKICAVDETWSGLKFVYRLEDR